MQRKFTITVILLAKWLHRPISDCQFIAIGVLSQYNVYNETCETLVISYSWLRDSLCLA